MNKWNQVKYIIGLSIIMLESGSALASLIASESFRTGVGVGDYVTASLGGTANKALTPTGTSGFSAANTWSGETSLIYAYQYKSLTLSGVPGSAYGGSVYIQGHSGGLDRASARDQAATPGASTYYLSTLIAGDGRALASGETMTIGFENRSSLNLNAFNVSSGIHVGLTSGTSGQNKLVAYAWGQAFDLLSIAAADVATRQIVMKLEIDGSGSDELLTVWINNGTGPLTQYASANLGDVYTSGTDLLTFVLQADSAAGSSGKMGSVDEMRFGTTLADVTTAPEPVKIVTLGLFGVGAQ